MSSLSDDTDGMSGLAGMGMADGSFPLTPGLNSDQFKATVHDRHAANSPFTADEVEGMTDDQFKLVRNDVAYMQRGGPEHAMNNAQEAIGGGLFTNSLEHIGDLTHRMNESYATRSEGSSGEFSSPKVNSQLGSLTHPYGYAREVAEQDAGNARYAAQNGKTFTPSTDEGARRDYVLEHSQLPVYSEPGHHAKAAAVHIGLRNFDQAREHLTALKGFLDDSDRYRQSMSRQGSIAWLRSQEPGAQQQ